MTCACGDEWCQAECGTPITCERCGEQRPRARWFGLTMCQPCATVVQNRMAPPSERRDASYLDRLREEERKSRKPPDVELPEGFRWAEKLRNGNPHSPTFTRYAVGCSLVRENRVVGRLVPIYRHRWCWVVGNRALNEEDNENSAGSRDDAARQLLARVTGRIDEPLRIRIADPRAGDDEAEVEMEAENEATAARVRHANT